MEVFPSPVPKSQARKRTAQPDNWKANKAKKASILIQPTLIFMNCVALALLGASLYHYTVVFDIPLMTEAGLYFIILFYGVIFQLFIKSHKPHFHYLVRSLREDYSYVCGEGSKYRKLFFKEQLFTWQFCLGLIVFLIWTVLTMEMATFIILITYLLKYDGGEFKRPFFFPFRFGHEDFSESPKFELMFSYWIVELVLYGFLYTFILQTQIVWIRQIMTKADLVKKAIKDMLEDVHPTSDPKIREYQRNLIESRMSHVVKLHHAMFESIYHYAAVYRKFLMFEQVILAPNLTFTAYSAAVKLKNGDFHLLLITLGIACASVLFIPTYLVTLLSEKVDSVSDVCWDMPFWNADPVIRPYMVLIMQRSRRKLPLSVGGLKEISVAEYANKVSLAYRCFNMLRQVDL